MRVLFLTLVYFTFTTTISAQKYNTETIASDLKYRANAIIRESNTTVDMRSADNVIINVTEVVTVFNKSGEKYVQNALYYDKNTQIRSLKGEIYDEFGKLMSKFSLSNFSDESAADGFSLFTDSRVKYFTPQVNTYPYTVYCQYEIKNKQNLIIPTWKPIPGLDVSVEKASYQFICNEADVIRTHLVNYKGLPQEEFKDKLRKLTWSVADVKALKHEPLAPNRNEYFTSVKIAPQNFTYYNFKGGYTNWKELGQISYDYLLKDLRALPQETILTVKNLVKDAPDDLTKTKLLYKYLQDKTRYISVQIGIGGFQPMLASQVDQLGYGDCKGLVNYMQALLEVVGINSYYCVVQADEEKVDLIPEFASMEQGNHIILCVPLKTDTIWLECTNKDSPFNYLGTFTDDRWVLACTKDGGKLLKTPKYAIQENKQYRTGSFKLAKDGSITGNIITTFGGSEFYNHFGLTKLTKNERINSLKHLYDVNNIEFDTVSLIVNNDKRELTENLAISIANYASINNDKITFLPNIFNVKRPAAILKKRTLNLEIKRGYVNIDSISFKLDDVVEGAIIPAIVNIENKFGAYHLSIKKVNNELIFYRKLLIRNGSYLPEEYENYSSFINEVASNDVLRAGFMLKK